MVITKHAENCSSRKHLHTSYLHRPFHFAREQSRFGGVEESVNWSDNAADSRSSVANCQAPKLSSAAAGQCCRRAARRATLAPCTRRCSLLLSSAPVASVGLETQLPNIRDFRCASTAGEQMKDAAFSEAMRRCDALVLACVSTTMGFPAISERARDMNSRGNIHKAVD